MLIEVRWKENPFKLSLDTWESSVSRPYYVVQLIHLMGPDPFSSFFVGSFLSCNRMSVFHALPKFILCSWFAFLLPFLPLFHLRKLLNNRNFHDVVLQAEKGSWDSSMADQNTGEIWSPDQNPDSHRVLKLREICKCNGCPFMPHVWKIPKVWGRMFWNACWLIP